MKVVKVSTLEEALRITRHQYLLHLDEIRKAADSAREKHENYNQISTHDAFNLCAKTTQMQEYSAKIELLENLVRFAEEVQG